MGEGVFCPTVCLECFWVAWSLVSWVTISHKPPRVVCNQGLVPAVMTVCYPAGALFIYAWFMWRQCQDCGAGIPCRAGDEQARSRGSIPYRGRRFLSLPKCLASQWSPTSVFYNGYRGLFYPGVKRSEREADHLARLKMGGALPPLLHMPSWLLRWQIYLCRIWWRCVDRTLFKW